MISPDSIEYTPGQRLTLVAVFSGSQVGTEVRPFYFGYGFGGLAVNLHDVEVDGVHYGEFASSGLDYVYDVPADQGFHTHTFSLTPGSGDDNTGMWVEFGTYGWWNGPPAPGYHGPILDRIALYQGAVPEPATWAFMIVGLGMTGAALRRRERLPVEPATLINA